ncbi:hypothetical protein BURMUCF2_3143 [Burkholderia multivorans CF2]|nr:hypothetical protein BURMUCF2_3143 [Burkholderia multivorans CF2]
MINSSLNRHARNNIAFISITANEAIHAEKSHIDTDKGRDYFSHLHGSVLIH